MPRAGKKTPASVPETAPWEDLKPRTKAQPRSENADPSVMLEQYAPIVIVFMSGITVVGRFLGVPWLFFLMVWGLLVVAYHEVRWVCAVGPGHFLNLIFRLSKSKILCFGCSCIVFI